MKCDKTKKFIHSKNSARMKKYFYYELKLNELKNKRHIKGDNNTVSLSIKFFFCELFCTKVKKFLHSKITVASRTKYLQSYMIVSLEVYVYTCFRWFYKFLLLLLPFLLFLRIYVYLSIKTPYFSMEIFCNAT